MSEQWLIKRNNQWWIWKRMTKDLGGGMLRCSCGTSDVKQARLIRDSIVKPVLLKHSAKNILFEIARQIKEIDAAEKNIVEKLKAEIRSFQSGDMLLSECYEKYCEYIENSSYRHKTKIGYTGTVNIALEIIDDKPINNVSVDDAKIVRDKLINDVSPKRLSDVIRYTRNFFKWCVVEKYCRPNLPEEFVVSLPKIRTKHTACFPQSAADDATVCTDWLAPRVARYTGMRLMEVVRLDVSEVFEENGIMIIKVNDKSKTHTERFVPVAEKLKPYLTPKNIRKLNKLGHHDDKYNKKVKEIPGCEECSFHSWRAYSNSQMHKNGVDPYICKKVIGHKNSKDVHAGYTYIEMEQMKAAVDVIY